MKEAVVFAELRKLFSYFYTRWVAFVLRHPKSCISQRERELYRICSVNIVKEVRTLPRFLVLSLKPPIAEVSDSGSTIVTRQAAEGPQLYELPLQKTWPGICLLRSLDDERDRAT